jgi:branched-chain amino acid transport system permease protein
MSDVNRTADQLPDPEQPSAAGAPEPRADRPDAPAGARGRSSLGPTLFVVGSVLVAASAFMSWSYDKSILGNVGVWGNPGTLQYFALLVGVLGLLLWAMRGPLIAFLPWVDRTGAMRGLGWGTLALGLVVLASIGLESSGLVNADPGAYVLLVGAALMAYGAWSSPELEHADALRVDYPGWVEILVIVAMLAVVLFLAAYILGIDGGGMFLSMLAVLVAIGLALTRAGFFQWQAVSAQRNRQVLMLGAVVVALLFPVTQQGSDANMSIAIQILIFATTALGLNIVVGLAGLLDLGYIAFLGAGAYVSAMMSNSLAATISWKPPFLVVAVIGAAVAATLGLIIGSPTLRVSGDYLAIVTLAFGEIFRITMNNLDGSVGPNLTNGPNGIPGIPDLDIFGFNFGTSHSIGGITFNRYANYYFLLLLVAAFVITVFTRLNNSRIGRGWVAIREDERAAEAMGVNVFGLKLFAFASGAFLAGLAGTVKAHQDVSISPDQFVFLESAFLLAAVVLGGMGTVAGVLVGATILKLLPEKLRFLADYRLLMFGALLVVMMRLRPEGIIPSARRQLEFHDEDEGLAERIEEVHLEEEEARA